MSDIIQIAFWILMAGLAILVFVVVRSVVLWYFGIQKIHDNQEETNRLLKILVEGSEPESKGDLGVPGLRVNPPNVSPKTIQVQSTKPSPYDLTRS